MGQASWPVGLFPQPELAVRSLLWIRAENLAAAAMQAMRPLRAGEKHEGAFAGYHWNAASLAEFERPGAYGAGARGTVQPDAARSEEHTSELQSLSALL